MNHQAKQQHDKPFSSSDGPSFKRQKLADTSASSGTTILLENKNKVQSSSSEHWFRANEENSYNIVNPVTTPQISFADIYSLQRLTKQYPAIQGGHS